MRIAVLANLKKNAPTLSGQTADQWDDLDSPETIESVIAALEAGGYQAKFFEASILPPHNLIEKLLAYDPDLCFNLAEGHVGDSRESQIPALLEMLNIPYTGSKVLALALALDKPMTKRILYYHGLPTPEFQVFEQATDYIDDDLLDNQRKELRFPLFVKPSREGTSVGISAESIVYTVDQLRDQVEKQLNHYHQPILVEHYIQGRELTIGVVGNLEKTAARRLNERDLPDELPKTLDFFPALEIDTKAYGVTEAGLYTNRVKVELVDDFRYHCPTVIDPDLEHQLQVLTGAVFRVIGCQDVARVDFRLDETQNNQPYILEVNPLPGLNPRYSDLCIQAKAAGWRYEELINAIVSETQWRYGMVQFGTPDRVTRRF